MSQNLAAEDFHQGLAGFSRKIHIIMFTKFGIFAIGVTLTYANYNEIQPGLWRIELEYMFGPHPL